MTMPKLLTLLLLTSGLADAASAQGAPADTIRPDGASFVDRFERLDPKRWYVSSGWSNGDYQDCVWARRNARLGAAGLELVLDAAVAADVTHVERKHACAEIQSHAFYGYGIYEARMKAAPGPGLVSAFFTYTGPPHGAGRPHDEIDFELLGKNRSAVQINYFVNGKPMLGKDVDLGLDGTERAVDYAIEWLPGSIRWFVNGRLVHRVAKGDGAILPDHPGKICFSLWNGAGDDMKNWLGAFVAPGAPLVATIELVAFTRVGDPCQFPDSIACGNRTSQ